MTTYPYLKQHIKREGDYFHVQNVRNFFHHSAEYFKEDYYDHTYNVDDLVGAHYVLAGFERPLNLLFAHVFVTFEFKNNVFVSVSVEAGRPMSDNFSYYNSFRKVYPLVYVIADEYDVLRSRTNVLRYDTYLYPINVTREHSKQLFSDMMVRAGELWKKPEWYHLVHNSCISELYKHFNNLKEVHLPTGLGTFFPGWLDFFAHRKNFFAGKNRWWNLRYRHRINELGKMFDAPDVYSKGVRGYTETEIEGKIT